MKVKVTFCMFYVVVPYSPLEPKTDVVFLVDSSRGVGEDDYRREKEFIKSLASHFNLHPSGARGTVVIYGNQPSAVVGFDDLQFIEKVDAAPLLGTPRRTDRALELAKRVFSTSKPGNRKILVLVTAGQQVTGSRPLREFAEPLRKLGTQRFVVVLGNKPDDRTLLPLVDRFQDIIRVPSSDRLSSQSQVISKQIREKPGNQLITYYRARNEPGRAMLHHRSTQKFISTQEKY